MRLAKSLWNALLDKHSQLAPIAFRPSGATVAAREQSTVVRVLFEAMPLIEPVMEIAEKDLHEALAPSVKSIAAGDYVGAVPSLAGAIATLLGSPLLGAAVEGGTALAISRVLASSATNRLVEEHARLSANDQEDHLFRYLRDSVRAIQVLHTQQRTDFMSRLSEMSERAAEERLELLRFIQNRFDEAISRAATNPLRGGCTSHPRLPAAIAARMFPALKRLARVADDLITSTDLHFCHAAESTKELASIVDEFTPLLDSYNEAYRDIRSEANGYRATLRSLTDAREALRDCAEGALCTALEGFEVYEPPEVADALPCAMQFSRIDAQWRQNRIQLQSNVHKLREDLEALEARVLADARTSEPVDERERRSALSETQALVTSYVFAAQDLADDAMELGSAALDSLEGARALAWQMAPKIVAMNDAYGRVEAHALALRSATNQASPQDAESIWTDVLGRVERFQWHEVRPSLNRLLLNIVWVIRDTAGPDTLRALQRDRGSHGWRGLSRLLRLGTKQFLGTDRQA